MYCFHFSLIIKLNKFNASKVSLETIFACFILHNFMRYKYFFNFHLSRS
ncbi:hypothetical protein BAZSYMA_ACONTIG98337_3 [Bathymodiolus azoricus thioautotrophic gill symbiont]|uniref:Uncharacterized protein n=1 Tax=Bathymodiolus azoricus thioautotrophic gill symbiont TaxID=235205 RepID=A0A1H6N4X5_9GAMM|nr:hypothetical protein BAZSYMA_ACONTIG98337_3 [Bathymodiolus azoricus thioautotrophic gill symbiont]